MNRLTKTILPALILLALFGTTLALPGQPGGSTLVDTAHAQGQAPNKFYLPMVANGQTPKTIFGMNIEQNFWDSFNSTTVQGTTWTRIVLPWSAIEPVENTFNWSAVAWVENSIKTATQNGIEVVLIIDHTPTWALKPGYSCGAVAQNKFAALQTFLTKTVQRYQPAPYSVENWELWNEPDVAGFLGCWGDNNDAYFGGSYYGEMLKYAYPAMKSAHNGARVMVGGLLLDCDPINPPAGKNCTPAKFLEGILLNGGGPYFDGVSFHAYDYYNNSLGTYSNSNWNSVWNVNGPTLIKKAAYVRSLLSQFGATGKFLMNTEVALICGATGTEPNCTTNDFENTKSYYIPQAYAAAIAENLDSNMWYSLLGWRGSQLLQSNYSPLPANTAMKTAASVIDQKSYSRKITEYGGLSGYELKKGGKSTWVIWSIDGIEHTIALPSTPMEIKDTFGNLVPVNGTTLKVNLKPLYVIW